MTREIKFRAWDKKVDKFDERFPRELKDFGELGWTLTSNDFEFQQYTGLKDKNGKEIYEGDIVDVGENIEVKFDNGAYVLLGKNYSDYLYNFEDIEVIGNVWENPELLT